jgi:stage II sporulation protein D
MLKTRLKSIVQLFKQYPWLLLSLLAGVQLAGVLLISRLSTPSAPGSAAMATDSTLANSSSNTSLQPDSAQRLPSSSKTPSPLAKTATKSATKSAPPSSISAPGTSAQSSTARPVPASQMAAPQLTANQQRLNEQYKQSVVNSAASVDSLIEMRVAIAEGVPAVTISSPSDVTLMSQDRQPLNSITAGTAYTVQPSAKGLTVNGSELPAVVLLEPASDATFSLGDRSYRGKLMLVNDGGKLWAVNLVNLRSYLHSVVASEVSSSWPQEALKAQSVAARSYALTYYFKPMSGLFHLGATEYYQVYSGIGREAASTNQAVDATAGEFVSYRGGIVESLYAASDDIVAEAFQGHGMSQLGALNLAEQGYSYQQILGGYYPNTGLGKFVSDYQ